MLGPYVPDPQRRDRRHDRKHWTYRNQFTAKRYRPEHAYLDPDAFPSPPPKTARQLAKRDRFWRTCRRCQTKRKGTEFPRDKARNSGRALYCKECHADATLAVRLHALAAAARWKGREYLYQFLSIRILKLTAQAPPYMFAFRATGGRCQLCLRQSAHLVHYRPEAPVQPLPARQGHVTCMDLQKQRPQAPAPFLSICQHCATDTDARTEGRRP